MRRICALAALAGMTWTVPAAAAPVGAVPAAKARALLLTPLTITRVQDLDFGTVMTSSTAGMVAINATSGARTTSGGVTGLSSALGQRARFAGAGTPGQQVFVLLVPPPVLTNGTGDTIDVLAMSLDGSPIRTIDSSRAFFVGVGGVLSVAADQAEGLYSAEFEIYADYQ
ncbi:DUF4402 domain-containing protein [Sphingomonas arenae]|uniref:DUF4402 domain-containing protein n=1 Tax=Sphingomonas arenae TaxID=2812555 RepID=UPI001967E0AE